MDESKKFAVWLEQHPDYNGPSGFVSIEAADAVAALQEVERLAKENDRLNSFKTYVEFSIPIDAARLAVSGNGGEPPLIQEMSEVFGIPNEDFVSRPQI